MAQHSTTSPETICNDGLQPGHDIFCTPENSSFHATNPYSDLDGDRHKIRLIRLLPDTGSGHIECELLEGIPLLDKKSQYTALSYCAGDAKNTGVVLVDGAPFTVFANLRHALEEVRDFWQKTYSDRECLLWIDQICINQKNIKERSHQVRFMRDIYEYAEQVLVCLSTKKCDPNGMDWVLGLLEDVPFSENEDWVSLEHRRKEYIIAKFHTRDKLFLDRWAAFSEVVKAPWWSRAWVLQEFIVAAKVYIMFSGRSISWDSWDPKTPVTELWSPPSMISDLHRCDPLLPQALCSVLERSNSFDPCTRRRMYQYALLKSAWRGKADLQYLLENSFIFHTTDPRDKIFAFVGMADPAYKILPDYSRSLAQVLIDTTIAIIRVENNLNVLARAVNFQSRDNSILPSWVVNWTHQELLIDPGSRDFDLTVLKHFDSIPGHNSVASFHKLQTPSGCILALQVEGVFIGTLVVASYQSHLGSEIYRTFVHDLEVRCLYKVRTGDEIWSCRELHRPLVLRAQQNHGYKLIAIAYGSNLLKKVNGGWVFQPDPSFDMKIAELGHKNPQIISII